MRLRAETGLHVTLRTDPIDDVGQRFRFARRRRKCVAADCGEKCVIAGPYPARVPAGLSTTCAGAYFGCSDLKNPCLSNSLSTSSFTNSCALRPLASERLAAR